MNFRTLMLLAATTLTVAFGADITGKWTATVPGRNGEQQTTFNFKQEGEVVTGTVAGPQGERPIADGKVAGDTVTFAVESQRGKQSYTGAIAGKEIKFKREAGQGPAREFTAKKAD